MFVASLIFVRFCLLYCRPHAKIQVIEITKNTPENLLAGLQKRPLGVTEMQKN
jgi:hypothetical protein